MTMMARLSQIHHRLVNRGVESPFDVLLFVLLIPLAVCYGVVTRVRNLLYDSGIFTVYKAAVPVIAVGNITAGGTGKTPFVDFLIGELRSRGLRPAVVSRGYGGRFRGKVGIVADAKGLHMSAVEAGDEPVLLARRHPSCPVVIAPRRVDAVKELERRQDADIIVMDDGFQHRSLGRDVDIVLLDAERPFGNGWTLPAGNLREFKSGLKRADLLIRTKCRETGGRALPGLDSFSSHYRLAGTAVALDGTTVDLESLAGRRLLAFSGIANPDRFFSDLENAGLQVYNSLSLADHVDYRDPAVADRLKDCSGGVEALITTEKDAVKLADDMFELPCYYVPISVVVEDSENMIAAVMKRLRSK